MIESLARYLMLLLLCLLSTVRVMIMLLCVNYECCVHVVNILCCCFDNIMYSCIFVSGVLSYCTLLCLTGWLTDLPSSRLLCDLSSKAWMTTSATTSLASLLECFYALVHLLYSLQLKQRCLLAVLLESVLSDTVHYIGNTISIRWSSCTLQCIHVIYIKN